MSCGLNKLKPKSPLTLKSWSDYQDKSFKAAQKKSTQNFFALPKS